MVAAALAAGVLAGCGLSPATTPAPSSSAASAQPGRVTVAPDGVQEVTLQTEDDFKFTPDHFTVKPGTVRLTVTNVGRELNHNFRFSPGKGPAPLTAEIPLLTSGQEQTITFAATTPGTYRFECSFHADLGQVGTMTVGG